MSATTERVSTSVFALKAGTFTLPTLKLFGNDMEQVAESLSKKVVQAPEFFRNTPIVIDLGDLEDAQTEVDFPLLVGLLRGYGMIPVGVRGGSDLQNDAAFAMELAVLASPKSLAASTPKRQQSGAARPHAPESVTSRLITRPVRSGQRLYMRGGDLIVTAAVSAGAEILADGNIHVYGPLRGRALAGVKGNRESRIFCQNLQAELVSVAGHYRVSENLRPQDTGKPVQIYLEERRLVIEAL